jgi:hypothetical protein
MVEKMMFDNQQKVRGRLSPQTSTRPARKRGAEKVLGKHARLKKLEMVEKFKKMHPEMDFSNVSLSWSRTRAESAGQDRLRECVKGSRSETWVLKE